MSCRGAAEMEIAEVLQPSPQGHVQERLGEQRVDVPVPPVMEEIVTGVPHARQERDQQRIAAQRADTSVHQVRS